MALRREATLARHLLRLLQTQSIAQHTEPLGARYSGVGCQLNELARRMEDGSAAARDVHSCALAGGLHASGRSIGESIWRAAACRKQGSNSGLPAGGEALQQRRTMVFGFGDGDEDKDLARHFKESRVIGYPPEQLFDVVAAVDFYEDFVPWCQRSEILMRKQEGPVEELEAELEVGFKLFTESYISHVTQEKPRYVRSTVSRSNLFEYLDCLWDFKEGPTSNQTALDFRVDFQFRSPLYHRVANLFFDEVAARMVSSFERRCEQVYGPPVEDDVVTGIRN